MRLLDTDAIGRRLRAALYALGLALGAGAAPAAAASSDAAALCDRHIARIEREAGVPPGLLRAIALAESGRWLPERRESRPWPWTVTAGTESFQLPTRAAALAQVRRLRAAGRSNIDVGCMQVNLHHHGDAFDGPEAALDPATNVAYAADFLRRLRERTRSWGLAVARYHTSDVLRGQAYRERVYRLWRDERRSRLAGAAARLGGDAVRPAGGLGAGAARSPRPYSGMSPLR